MLKERGWTPDLVLASNSKRTKQTLDEMAEVMHELADVDAHYYGSLYTVAALDGQTRDHILECLLEVCDDAKNRVIMCVGHNKGWEEAASQLAGQAVKLRTASAALLQCYAPSWKDVLKLPSSKEEGAEQQQAGRGAAAAVQWQLVEVVTPQVV
ncbi:hypothetical protein HYH02_006038 [Chlamydomonas schloesseri]|uniref:Uncharacterized protein n=1 Tax=Chlamydomonas schloesseri TaxID=2026947 RepID=A0A835WKD6_9CHLO|nr:hypothetical protein HYH02_006038 [Chlamydomonas schloesseri]|eukprot:KAG2448681.1 hypothetical protein HYH02_006038 [Chlamydomonas schloesseri]